MRNLAIIKDPYYKEQLERFFEKIGEPYAAALGKIMEDSDILPYLVFEEGNGWISSTYRNDLDVITAPIFIAKYNMIKKPKKSLKSLLDAIDKSTDPLNLVFQWVKIDTITYNTFRTLIEYIEEKKRKDYELDNFK
jgi:hypothetical protein